MTTGGECHLPGVKDGPSGGAPGAELAPRWLEWTLLAAALVLFVWRGLLPAWHQLLTDFLTLLRLDKQVIHHDVEGMEHHISPPTLRAIEALTAQLKRRPALLARLK